MEKKQLAYIIVVVYLFITQHLNHTLDIENDPIKRKLNLPISFSSKILNIT
jgi:hypothetical protein